jgi:translocation and assembly module TamA
MLSMSACATIPKGQYGVSSIQWIGVHDVSSEALAACLVTRQREPVTVRLGLGAPSCGSPPFNSSAPRFELWTTPWTEWPVYDPAIFEVERRRIERWYQARGYFDARVVSVQTLIDGKQVEPDECKPDANCKLKIIVKMSEGKPTQVSEVELSSSAPLPAAFLARLRDRLQLRRGARFDESSYDADKTLLSSGLINASYAHGKVTGKIIIDRTTRQARVEYKLDPGPKCVFGTVSVEGLGDSLIPGALLIQAANIPRGEAYDQGTVDDAERAIFALNVFSSVKLEPQGDGKVVDFIARVQPGRIATLSAGAGLMSGTLRRATSVETTSVPQWDVHLKGSWENRNFLGGLRKLRIEERPRVIFQRDFPGVPPGPPRLGNTISLQFEQPATFEARTKLVSSAGWDLGPDPYRGFFRHDVAVKVGLERPFWKRRLLARVAVENDYYNVKRSEAPDNVSNYVLPFLEQQVVVDLRGNPQRPRLGAYLSVLVQEASKLGSYGSWDYVRVLPDARAYVPLLFDVVLAARFALGGLFVFGTKKPGLDDGSAALGPDVYRFRGGGANSNRGFAAGQLGDGPVGGSRRFEGSLELRVPLGGDLGLVFFGDVGDVNSGGIASKDATGSPTVSNPQINPPFRFTHLNTAAGFGLRYYTIIGALRFDAGWRIPGLQVVGGHDPEPALTLKPLPSAMHLTIGEAF